MNTATETANKTTAQAAAPAAAPGTQIVESRKLIPRIADRYGVDANKLLSTLRATVFKQDGENFVTDEEMLALLVVADQYKLNPFTKEIFAFFDKKKGVIPIVSVDGWSRIINSHDDYDGIEFRYSENIVNMTDGKPCPEWCEAVIYHKNRSRPTVVREFLDEVYVPKRNNFTGPWQTHTKRFLRHKTLIQGSRVAFGFSGIYDEDEAGRIVEVTVIPDTAATTGSTATLEEQLKARDDRKNNIVDADFTDTPAAAADAVDAEPASTETVVEHEAPAIVDLDALDPITLDEKIKAATTDAEISVIVDTISALSDPEARRDLTRRALARKTELMREAGRA